MIYIFYTKISEELSYQVFCNYLSELPEELKQKNYKYLNYGDKLRHLFGKKLLQDALQKIGFTNIGLFDIEYNKYGRPNIKRDPEFDFSITHSGSYVLCGIAKNMKIGIDIEKIVSIKFSDFDEVMTTNEWDIIFSSDRPLNSFFSFWTKKESIIKADSRGLSIPLKEIEVLKNVTHYDGNLWYLNNFQLDLEYASSIAVNVVNHKYSIEYISYY